MDIQNQETAIQNEQQLKSRQEIVNDIIGILADNNLSIIDAKEILYETSKMVCRQPVKSFS